MEPLGHIHWTPDHGGSWWVRKKTSVFGGKGDVITVGSVLMLSGYSYLTSNLASAVLMKS